MRACALTAPRRLEAIEIASAPLGPHDVRLRPTTVGVCGTDFHIFAGEANFHLDADGRPIPLTASPQILGHEVVGTVIERGRAVADLAIGATVVVDQGRNCRSERREPLCEYCRTGHSHQCEHYREHGITGLPGGFADELVVPAVNTIPVAAEAAGAAAVLTEPLACVLHCLDFGQRATARFRLGAPTGDDARVRTVVVLGGGPAGLLFVQALRRRHDFDGDIVLSDPSEAKRRLAAAAGAFAVAPAQLEAAVLERSRGRRAELLVEASGSGHALAAAARVIQKQATVLLYGVGHGDAPLQLLNPLQWREAVLVTSVGASGGFDADGRPSIYREALRLLGERRIVVDDLVTHRYRGLDRIPAAFAGDHCREGYVKGIVELS